MESPIQCKKCGYLTWEYEYCLNCGDRCDPFTGNTLIHIIYAIKMFAIYTTNYEI